MTQKYDVILEAQMGQRFGTLVLDETDGNIKGVFSLLGFDNPVSGRCTGGRLVLRHKLRTILSTLNCETQAELRGDTLSGVVISQYNRMKLHGKKRKDDEQNELSQ